MKQMQRYLMAWMILLAVSLGMGVQAQPTRQAEENLEQQSSPQALLQEMEQVQQELLQIQEMAMAHNPELEEQAQALQQVMLDAMRDEGFEPMQSLDRMEQLERQLQADNVDPAERPALAEELRTEQQRLMQAEQTAMANAEVQEAREQFMEGLLQAMREQEPRTDELIGQLKEKNAQLQEIVSARSN